MKPIFCNILFSIFFVLFACEAYPGTLDSKEVSAEEFSKFLNYYERLRSNNLGIDSDQEVWIPKEDENGNKIRTNIDPLVPGEPYIYEYAVDKKASFKPRYNYYKCYFNPVTCFRK